MDRSWLSADRGSLAPLGVGLFALTMALIFVISSASSLFIFQKRLTNYSESAALYVAATGEDPQSFAVDYGVSGFKNLIVKAGNSEDGLTAEVSVCALWSAPIYLVGSIVEKQVCSHASARSG